MFWFRSSSQPEPAECMPITPEPPSFGSSFVSVVIEPVQPSSSDNDNDCQNYCWLIFTCVNSRAIHLEFAKPGDSASVVDAINRFFKMWNVPREILFYEKHSFQGICDNARIRLGNLLPMLKAVHKFDLVINPAEPLWNKFYPILIYTLRFALCTIENADSINACHVKQIEEIVNSRPILKHGNNWEIITPEHLVTGCAFASFEPIRIGECNELVKFWNKWSLKYLFWLKEFHNLASYVPSAGELVLLCDSKPESSTVGFKIAVIEELLGCSEGLLTRARIQFPSGETLEQDVQNLISLECSQNIELLNSVLFPLQEAAEGQAPTWQEVSLE